jgi:hypothetical protein
MLRSGRPKANYAECELVHTPVALTIAISRGLSATGQSRSHHGIFEGSKAESLMFPGTWKSRIRCLLGAHELAAFNCEVCERCGVHLGDRHLWNGCTCSKCGIVRDESHVWNGCKCSQCGKVRYANHIWNGCTCSKCGIVRDEAASGMDANAVSAVRIGMTSTLPANVGTVPSPDPF